MCYYGILLLSHKWSSSRKSPTIWGFTAGRSTLPLPIHTFYLLVVLSGLCRQAQETGSLPGISVARQSPFVNHLLFADDTMFFCKSDAQSCATLASILQRYESASGQSINLAKSSITTFSAKTPLTRRVMVKSKLKIVKEGGTGKYLGLPENFGRRKRDIFTTIVDRVQQKAHSYSTRFLSPKRPDTHFRH